MHELSIAMSIVEIAAEESKRRGGLRVKAVHLRLGVLAGVTKDALLFSYHVATENTSLAGSQLLVEEVSGLIFCPQCKEPRAARNPEWFMCPDCGAPASELVQGKELEVVALEVEG